MTRPRWTLGLIGLGVVAGGLIVALAIQPPAIQVPPDSAPPEVVLDTGFVPGHDGDLCSQTHVTAYQVLPGSPAYPNGSEAVFAVQLTTTGTDDGTLQAGGLTWFYSLDRQTDGSWRITGGGSGP